MLEEILELHKQGKLDEAESRYRELLTFNPDDPETLHLLAMVRRQRGDIAEAVRLVHRAIELSPERANYYATLAGMEFHGRRFDLAKQHFEKAIELNPNFTGAYSALGQIAMLEGERERAEEYFKLALKANPDQPQVLNSYGNLYLARGDADTALKYLTRASELAPNDPTVLGSLGRAHLRTGHAAFAEEALKRALSLSEAFHPARLLLAEAQMQQQRFRDARESIVPLLRLDAQKPAALAAIGDIARAEGKLAEAVNYYRDSLALERGQPGVTEALAWTLMQRGLRREAVAAYREYLGHAPTDRAARRALVNLLLELREHESAIVELERALADEPNDLDAKTSLAAVTEINGALARADELARDVLAERPHAFAPTLVAARAALRHGDAAAARTRLDALAHADLTPSQRRLADALRGHVLDRLDDPVGASGAWLAAHAALEARPRPSLREVPEGLAEAIAVNRARGTIGAELAPRALLVGAPGSGVERVAALLADSAEVLVLADRYGRDPRHDELEAPQFGRYAGTISDEDARLFVRHYVKPLERLGLPSARALIDWLPHFDARFLPILHRAFGPTRLVVVTRGERAELLDWLAYGGAHGWRIESLAAAKRYLADAHAHLEFAETHGGMPIHVVDADAVVRDPAAAAAALAGFLDVSPWTPGDAWSRASAALGGLPAELPPGRDAAYAAQLA